MIYYKLQERKATLGKLKGQTVQIAHPTNRKRLSTVDFCELVADSTTFNRHEVQGVINRMAEVACRELQRGSSIEMGDFGTLSPTFKSQSVPVGTEFNAAKHISKPRVRMRLKPRFATILDVETNFSELKADDQCKAPSTDPSTEPSTPPAPGGNGGNGNDPAGNDQIGV